MIKNSVTVILIIAIVFIASILGAQLVKSTMSEKSDTLPITVKKNIESQRDDQRPANHLMNYTMPKSTKEDIDWTGTTQGILYYSDTTKANREQDSIDAFMKYWYEVLDTNGDGEIDNLLDYYEMDCGGEVYDSIIEWLEE